MKTLIQTLKDRVCQGGDITLEEALQLTKIQTEQDLGFLQEAAQEITFHFNSREAGLCSLINAKSNLCAEDCSFCSQSVRYQTDVKRYPLMKPEEVLEVAKGFEKKGVKNFCVVTSGGSLTDEEFERILDIYRLLRKETKLNLDGSLGFMTSERARRLKEVGCRRFNDNLQTSREFYKEIVSTHTYETRLDSLKVLRDESLEICAGGILGLGESDEDRIRMAFELKPYKPECLPVNILNPRPGTPLENKAKTEPAEILKIIAIFRFIHPQSNIKLAGGRELNLGDTYQLKALQGGANGLIIGGYLTTAGDPIAKDAAMLVEAGFELPQGMKSEETASVSGSTTG